MSESAHLVPIELSYIVPCYLDQQGQSSLTELLQTYAQYRPELMDRIQFVIVDDCSPVPITLPPNIDLNIRLLRIETDITWNQAGARNLGVVYAQSDKVIATDLDHMFPEQTLEYIVDLPALGKRMYKPCRKDPRGADLEPHPNTFIMSRGRFLECYGYDEEFCGAYGYEDGMFWRWQRYNGTRFGYMKRRYPILVRKIKEETYHSLKRDKSRNAVLRSRKMQEISRFGPAGGHSRQFLNFTWKMVEDRKRRHLTWQFPKNMYWKKFWWLRWLKC